MRFTLLAAHLLVADDRARCRHAVISTCALAIAETGAIVLDGWPGQGRRALTLLPDYHLCVIRVDQIVAGVPMPWPGSIPGVP